MIRLTVACLLSLFVAALCDVGLITPGTASWCAIASAGLIAWYLLRPTHARRARTAARTATPLPRRPRIDDGLYAKRYELIAADLAEHGRPSASEQNVTSTGGR